jgi:hypothetical protein
MMHLSTGIHNVIAYQSAQTTVLSPRFAWKTVYSKGSPGLRIEVQLNDDLALSHSGRPFPSLVAGLF